MEQDLIRDVKEGYCDRLGYYRFKNDKSTIRYNRQKAN
jgi:hypothetical protein